MTLNATELVSTFNLVALSLSQLPSATTLPSHKRPYPEGLHDLTAKGSLIHGEDDAPLLVRRSTIATPSGRPLSDDPIRIKHACHADASCHLGITPKL